MFFSKLFSSKPSAPTPGAIDLDAIAPTDNDLHSPPRYGDEDFIALPDPLALPAAEDFIPEPPAPAPTPMGLFVQGVGKVLEPAVPRWARWLGGTAAQPRTILEGIDLHVPPGKTLGIVGESGSGKSTLARILMALDTPTSGQVYFNGQDLHQLSAADLRTQRRHFQMVFQDPSGSLNPRMPVGVIVAEPLQALGAVFTRAQQRLRVAQALEQVGLRVSDAQRWPHEFSGGQRQRIAIARAIVTRPRLIVADEPVSALDASVQAQVLNLMLQLQQNFGISYVLISHDLAVVSHMCDEIIVMHEGRIVERGTPRQITQAAHDPQTRALLAAMTRIEPGAARQRYALRQLHAQGQLQPEVAQTLTIAPASAAPVPSPSAGSLPQFTAQPKP